MHQQFTDALFGGNFRISGSVNTALIGNCSIVADSTNNFMEKIDQNEDNNKQGACQATSASPSIIAHSPEKGWFWSIRRFFSNFINHLPYFFYNKLQLWMPKSNKNTWKNV